METMSLLRRGASELGLHLEPRQLSQFRDYYHELATWNQRMNLTSVVDYEGVQVRHLLDSLTAAPLLRDRLAEGGSLLDVGAGGGFPGVPLKI
ncbi:MAG: 16S rRNA (guanine(527)-N(7))-methyltransferase RsmG, partial [Dehalococcoidia bacterium]